MSYRSYCLPRRLLHLCFTLVLVAMIAFAAFPNVSVVRAADATKEEELASPVRQHTDPLQESFSTAPVRDEAGGLDFKQILKEAGIDPNAAIERLGYDPSRFWKAGTGLADIVLLGDLKDSGIFEDTTLEMIAQMSGISVSTLTLADLAPARWQTLASLARALPHLRNLSLEDVPIVLDIAQKIGLPVGSGQSIAVALSNPRIADLMLGNSGIDLAKYPLSSIPGLSRSPLSLLSRWEESPLSGVPGLADVPFATLFSGLFGGGITATLDLPWGEKEARRVNTITGSYRVGFGYPCSGKSCAYVELSGNDIVHGKQWISGKSQKVPGGFGCVRGKEPTGRHPFGAAFKVVLSKTVESDGRADFSFYFPLSLPCGGQLYVLGPFPWMSYHEKDAIFVGPVDASQTAGPQSQGSGTSESETPSPDELTPINPDLPVQDECETYKGVSVGAMKTAIARIESQGQGNYNAVGPYVCDSSGLCGRALGKYQFMTYREDVTAAISSVPGGAQFLAIARDQNTSADSISAQMSRYFPPRKQEALMDAWMRVLIDQATASGASGDAAVEKGAALHNSGLGGSSPEYGKRAASIYRQVKPGIARLCGSDKALCTGAFANPAPGYPKTDVFGACRPLGRCTRLHQGVDLGTPRNTPVYAADGGTVRFVGTRGCYGLTVDIEHCRIGRITRYAHLASASVLPGDTVTKGQDIARTGDSGCGSGPHLHFEVHPAGSPDNPEKYVQF